MEEQNDVILDFSTLEPEVEIPDLKDDPDKTKDLTEVVEEVKEVIGE